MWLTILCTYFSLIIVTTPQPRAFYWIVVVVWRRKISREITSHEKFRLNCWLVEVGEISILLCLRRHFFCGVKYEISVRGGQVAIEISSHRCWMNGICGCLLIVNDVEEKIKCAVFNLFLFSYKLVGLKLNETTSTTWVKSERMFWWKVEEIWTSSLVHEKVNDGRSQWHLRRVMNEPNEIDGPPQNLIYVAFLFPTIHDFSIMLKINKSRGKKFKWRKQEEKFLQ